MVFLSDGPGPRAPDASRTATTSTSTSSTASPGTTTARRRGPRPTPARTPTTPLLARISPGRPLGGLHQHARRPGARPAGPGRSSGLRRLPLGPGHREHHPGQPVRRRPHGDRQRRVRCSRRSAPTAASSPSGAATTWSPGRSTTASRERRLPLRPGDRPDVLVSHAPGSAVGRAPLGRSARGALDQRATAGSDRLRQPSATWSPASDHMGHHYLYDRTLRHQRARSPAGTDGQISADGGDRVLSQPVPWSPTIRDYAQLYLWTGAHGPSPSPPGRSPDGPAARLDLPLRISARRPLRRLRSDGDGPGRRAGPARGGLRPHTSTSSTGSPATTVLVSRCAAPPARPMASGSPLFSAGRPAGGLHQHRPWWRTT